MMEPADVTPLESNIPKGSIPGADRVVATKPVAGGRLADRAASVDADERTLIERLRRGDEAAFVALVDRYHGALLRLATAYVSDLGVAEEVVQETWLGVIEGIDRFEGRSSLKTWIYRILTNRAKTKRWREGRTVPLSSMSDPLDESDEHPVDADRYHASGYWTGHWSKPPDPWDDRAQEKVLLSKEGTALLDKAIAMLPPNQRQVILMRDVEGMDSKEVCALLEMSEANQRVLLHRARSKVRRALDPYLRA